MIQLKSLRPNFFLYGSAGIVNANSPYLGCLGSWVHVTLLGSGTDKPEFIRIIQWICIHKTLEFEDEI